MAKKKKKKKKTEGAESTRRSGEGTRQTLRIMVGLKPRCLTPHSCTVHLPPSTPCHVSSTGAGLGGVTAVVPSRVQAS